MTPPRLAVVTVNWNGGREVVQNVRALAAIARRRGDVEMVLVDNASSDGFAEQLASLVEAPTVQLVVNDHNAGFGPACNQGARIATADLVLFLNPDVSPRIDDDPFGPLIEEAARDGAHAGFAPLLEHSAEQPGLEAPRFFQFRRHAAIGPIARELLLVHRLAPRSSALRHHRYEDVDRSVPFEVEQPAAAAWALRREVFLSVGGFDPRFVPAWWEDVDLARRLAQRGHRTVTVPGARLVHRGQSALVPDGDRPAALRKPDFHRVFWRNLLRFAGKWWGVGGVLVVRVLLATGACARMIALLAPRVHARAEHLQSAVAILGVAISRR